MSRAHVHIGRAHVHTSRAHVHTSRAHIVTAALLSVALVGCAEMGPLDESAPSSCAGDDECASLSPAYVCIIGVCADPQNQALDQVHLEVRPLESSGYRPQQLLEITPSDDVRTLIELKPTVTLAGTVVDGVGLPVAAQVFAVEQGGIAGRALIVSADASGASAAFSLPLVDERSYRLSVWPTDSTRPPYLYPDPLDGVRGTLPVQLPDAGALVHVVGRVVTGEGTAVLGVGGLEVRVLSGKRRVSSVALTTIEGQFTVDVAEVSAEEGALVLEVRPTEENRLTPTVRLELADLGYDEERVIDVGEIHLGVLGAPVPFSGVVNGPDGQPVAGANIYLCAALGGGDFCALVIASENGRYESELRPASYEFAVVAPPANPTAGLLVGFVADVGGAAPSPVLNLPARVLASGRVVDDDSLPVANATVQLTRIAGFANGYEPVLSGLAWTFSAVTDEEGRWQQQVDPGRYRVVVVPDASATRPQHTTIVDIDGANAIALELFPPAVVAGNVTDEGGGAIGMATVTAYARLVGEMGAAIELGTTQAKADGSFELLLPDLSAAR